MKKIVLVNGLISGIIVSAFMLYSVAQFYSSVNFEDNMWIVFAGMILAFSSIFFAVKTYRDKHNNGYITFGKAFKIGFLISLIASTLYVFSWLVDYYMFVPDFMDRYTEHVLRNTNPEDQESKAAEMSSMNEMYKNPVMVVLFTYSEILPLGIVLSLISAAVFRRKPKNIMENI